MSSAAQTDAQLLEAARRLIASHTAAGQRSNVPRRDYHGPIDLDYVRPAPTEFPKMVYKASKVDSRGYITRVVNSQEEQDALPKGWLTTTAQVHALLDPIAKQQYVTADDVQGEEPEEKEHSKTKAQAVKDSKGK